MQNTTELRLSFLGHIVRRQASLDKGMVLKREAAAGDEVDHICEMD